MLQTPHAKKSISTLSSIGKVVHRSSETAVTRGSGEHSDSTTSTWSSLSLRPDCQSGSTSTRCLNFVNRRNPDEIYARMVYQDPGIASPETRLDVPGLHSRVDASVASSSAAPRESTEPKRQDERCEKGNIEGIRLMESAKISPPRFSTASQGFLSQFTFECRRCGRHSAYSTYPVRHSRVSRDQ